MMPSQPRPILKRASHSFTPSSPTSSYFPSTAHPPENTHTHKHHSVRFPPSPTLTRTFSAYSPSSYDRSPIVVLPNSCALPARGCPGRTYIPGDVSPPRAEREGRKSSPKTSPSSSPVPSPEKRGKAMKSKSKTMHPRAGVVSSPGLQPIALPLPYSSSPLASTITITSSNIPSPPPPTSSANVTPIPNSTLTPTYLAHAQHHTPTSVPTHLPDLTPSSSASESDESDGFVSPPPLPSLSASLSSLPLSAPIPIIPELSLFNVEDEHIADDEDLTPPANMFTSLSLSPSSFSKPKDAELSEVPPFDDAEEDEAYEEYYTYEEETRRRRRDRDRDRDRERRRRKNERNGGGGHDSRSLGLNGGAGKTEAGGQGGEEEEEEEGEGGDADDDIGGRRKSSSGSGSGSGRRVRRGSKGGRGEHQGEGEEEGHERGRYKSFVGTGLRFGGFGGEEGEDDGCLGGF